MRMPVSVGSEPDAAAVHFDNGEVEPAPLLSGALWTLPRSTWMCPDRYRVIAAHDGPVRGYGVRVSEEEVGS